MANRTAAVVESEDGVIDLNALPGMDGNMWEGDNERSYALLPDGKYDAQIVVVEGPTLNKKQDGYWIKIQYAIVGNSNPEFNNRRVFQIISLKQTANWKIQEFFKAMGKEAGDTRYTPGEFDGMFCTIVVGTRPATGEYAAQNEVKKTLPVSDEFDVNSGW